MKLIITLILITVVLTLLHNNNMSFIYDILTIMMNIITWTTLTVYSVYKYTTKRSR